MKYIVVLCAMILTSCALPKDNFSKWERCLNKSDLTDYDCEKCDRKHNPSRNFTMLGDTVSGNMDLKNNADLK